jgi:hypothetical protein
MKNRVEPRENRDKIMANALLTLTDLFLGKQQLTEDELKKVEQAADTQEAREQLTGRDEPLDWLSGWGRIQSEIPRLFDVSLLDILLASWEKYRLVSKYAEPDAQAPGKRTTLDLDKRSLSSTHKPSIELRYNDQLIKTLVFTIKLQLQFKTVRLTVGDGRIWRIELGECEGTGSLLMGKQTILKRSFIKVDLPGQIDFSEGIAIPTLGKPYQWGDGPRALVSRV